MSAPAIAVPGSVQRQETKLQPETISSQQEDIANLAYGLCQQRGCPEGSSEEDWLQAEQMKAGDRQSQSGNWKASPEGDQLARYFTF
jgi:hypothetical protein